MSVCIGEIELFNLAANRRDEAKIMMGLDDSHLANFRDSWFPQLQGAITDIRECHTSCDGQIDKEAIRLEISEKNLQDSHWRWDTKWYGMEMDLSKVLFAVECDNTTQAFLAVDNANYLCKHPGNVGENLIYVEYVAVAPWNRRGLVEKPIFGGLGKTLMGVAISLSIEEEFDGRVGLHSLPQADNFYSQKCGMTDFGPDATKQGLRYFEMTTVQANEFLGNR